MTTLAFRNNILAADTQLTVGDTKLTCENKILILNDRTIFAAAGYDDDIAKASIFFRSPEWTCQLGTDKAPVIKRDFEAFLWYDGYMYAMDKPLIPTIISHSFYALGSGWQLAYSAMVFGLPAIDAVKFAGEHDIYTNSEVRWINVKAFKSGKGKIRASKGHSYEKASAKSLEEASKGG